MCVRECVRECVSVCVSACVCVCESECTYFFDAAGYFTVYLLRRMAVCWVYTILCAQLYIFLRMHTCV